jgi:hypothetical protein
MRKRSQLCMEEDSPREDLHVRRTHQGRIGRWWMAIGGVLGSRKFPVSCEGVVFSRIGVPAKQLRSRRKGMGVWRDRKKERERERAGWEGAGRARSLLEVHPNLSHGTKC